MRLKSDEKQKPESAKRRQQRQPINPDAILELLGLFEAARNKAQTNPENVTTNLTTLDERIRLLERRNEFLDEENASLRCDNRELRDLVDTLQAREVAILRQFEDRTGEYPKLHPGCWSGCTCWLADLCDQIDADV